VENCGSVKCCKEMAFRGAKFVRGVGRSKFTWKNTAQEIRGTETGAE
jgi:hypothetical protein